MNIEISGPSDDQWIVRMDAFVVRFDSKVAAQSFVDQLKARIDAPHAWPTLVDTAPVARPRVTRAADPIAL